MQWIQSDKTRQGQSLSFQPVHSLGAEAVRLLLRQWSVRAVLLQREVIEPHKDIERKPVLGIKSQAVRFVRKYRKQTWSVGGREYVEHTIRNHRVHGRSAIFYVGWQVRHTCADIVVEFKGENVRRARDSRSRIVSELRWRLQGRQSFICAPVRCSGFSRIKPDKVKVWAFSLNIAFCLRQVIV